MKEQEEALACLYAGQGAGATPAAASSAPPLAKRSRLARTVLTKALNDAATDDWEIVQMTTAGTSGGLVYLLRKR